MAVKSLKELQLPGSADSYTFDASLFDGKTPDLFALLGGNNAFTGTNSFSNAISVDTINSKSTGNSIVRMYYDTDKEYKVLLGSVARQITLLGNTDRPYYAKNGEAFNAHELALKEDIPTVLSGYAKLSGSNTFTGSNDFNTDGRVLSIKDGNFCSNESFIPLRTISNNQNFGIRGVNGTVYDLDEFPKPDSDGKLSFGGGKADSMLSIAEAGNVNSAKYVLLATMQASDASSWACVFVKGRIGGWGTNTIDVDVRIQGRDGPYITGTAHSINSWGMSAALEVCDIIATVNADLTMSVWLKVSGYYSYALDVRCAANGSKVAYAGTQGLITGGTVKDRLSTSSYVMKVFGTSATPPVGTILAFADDTQPASLYSNTTWQKIEGRFIIGANSIYKAGTTGGSASHTHSLNGYQAHANVGLTIDGRVSCSNGQYKGSTQTDGRSIGTGKTPDVAYGWEISYTATLGGNTVSTGNIPPYIAYNLWVRTA